MQLHNATISLEAPLQYPPNVVIGHQFPITKRDLLRLTGKHVTGSSLHILQLSMRKLLPLVFGSLLCLPTALWPHVSSKS